LSSTVDLVPLHGATLKGRVELPADVTLVYPIPHLDRWRGPSPWPRQLRPESYPDHGEEWQSIHRLQDARPGPDGSYRIEGLAAGRYRLRLGAVTEDNTQLWGPFYLDSISADTTTTIELAAGETRQLEPIQLVHYLPSEHHPSTKIVGKPVVGETLTVVVTDVHPDVLIEHQWQRNSFPMEGQRGSTFLITPDEVGMQISVATLYHGRAIHGSFDFAMLSKTVLAADSPLADTALAPLDALDLATLPALRDILSWVRVNAPGTYSRLRRGNEPETIASAESALAVEFPEQLRTLLAAIDGEEQGESIVPMGRLMPLEELQQDASFLREAAEAREIEGTTFIPFAGQDGCDYCLRISADGTDIVFVDDVDGVDHERGWADLNAFFADILASLTSGEPFYIFTPAIVGDELTWDLAD